ncbi:MULTISPECIES: MetJ regulator of methionine regulon [unclassified Pseudoalteromonas]|uniref:MetJ regulator of methionine regulon n=1 Tax=unclassified Pseudoalteromonas TaxID=194690 RepID=UPI00140A11F4|nr:MULTISPECIES: MetJ regulator of methionine regulon [unclassified Pseudoalteromonas]MBH0028800.1 MetJ regulator of methionine regulon [Pseudoalteromonas sp. SWN29]MBH0040197.1 MetJ regulator of methionine regulon [Pseudoalteromonas sp. SWN166]
MEKFKLIILIAGSIFILCGYLRFITDENGNVNLNNYRFTGGLLLVVSGMIDGTRDLVKRLRSKNSLSAIAIYLGILLFYIGFSI